MNWFFIILLVVVVMVIQRYFIYLQSKNYNQILIELKRKGNLGVGIAKGAFSGCVVIICSDENRNVIDGRILKGFSTFSRFKELPDIKGKSLDELENEEIKDKKYMKAVKIAIEQINKLEIKKAEEKAEKEEAE